MDALGADQFERIEHGYGTQQIICGARNAPGSRARIIAWKPDYLQRRVGTALTGVEVVLPFTLRYHTHQPPTILDLYVTGGRRLADGSFIIYGTTEPSHRGEELEAHHDGTRFTLITYDLGNDSGRMVD